MHIRRKGTARNVPRNVHFSNLFMYLVEKNRFAHFRTSIRILSDVKFIKVFISERRFCIQKKFLFGEILMIECTFIHESR